MHSKKRLTAIAMTLVFPLLMSTGSYVEAQGAKARAEAKEAAKAKITAAKEALKLRSSVRTQALRALNRPTWTRELDQEQVDYYNISQRNAIGVTMRDLLTTRTSPISSIRTSDPTVREDCVSCHGKSDYLQNGIELEFLEERAFCNLVRGFRANRTKPANLKRLLRDLCS